MCCKNSLKKCCLKYAKLSASRKGKFTKINLPRYLKQLKISVLKEPTLTFKEVQPEKLVHSSRDEEILSLTTQFANSLWKF